MTASRRKRKQPLARARRRKEQAKPPTLRATPSQKPDRLVFALAAAIGLLFVARWFVTADPYLGSGTDIVTFEYPALAFAHSRLQQFDSRSRPSLKDPWESYT